MPALLLLCALGVAIARPGAASAQPGAQAGALPFTGTELAFQGGSVAYAGRPFPFRGTAYRVRGLAELVPYGGAQVQARWVHEAAERGGPLRAIQADARGVFEGAIDLPEALADATGIELRLEQDGEVRSFVFPISPVTPATMQVRFDRVIYEPGETAHLWVRLDDRATGRPMEGSEVRVVVDGAVRAEQTLRTRRSGVASLTVEIPEGGSGPLSAQVRAEQIQRSVSATVGGRQQARLFLDVELSPETANPLQPVQVAVHVRAPSGAPIRDAEVRVLLDSEREAHARTDEEGWARLSMTAPSYLRHETGTVPVEVQVQHPAFGTARRVESLRLAVPLVLNVEAAAERASLIPEIDDRVYLEVLDGAGDPPPVGTEVEVRGEGVRNGRQVFRTDDRGFVVVPVRLPPEGATTLAAGPTAHLRVHVPGPLPRIVTLPLRVDRDAVAAPRATAPVVAPGDPIEVALLRRPSARQRALVVELMRREPEGTLRLIAHTIAGPGEARARLRAPQDRLGLYEIRVRPALASGLAEGHGSSTAILVRPRIPTFPEILTDRPRYEVGERVRLTLRTPAGAPGSYAAVLVRDLAAHAGEHSFRERFLTHDFERALLDPSQPTAEPLLRAALASYLHEDRVPTEAPPLVDALGLPTGSAYYAESSVSRDPFPLAEELLRRGIAEAMRGVERLLTEALENDALDGVTVSRGGRRQFRPDLLADLEEPPQTLGEGEATVAMIAAADPSFTYDNVARRVARRRLVRLYVALAAFLDPGEGASLAQLAAAQEPSERWLTRMQREGLIEEHELRDPWGGRFTLRRNPRPALVVGPAAATVELVSPGPDGRLGTADDYRDPFARVVPAQTPYAVASGEDALIRQLASTNPTEEVLAAMLEAFDRRTPEMLEDAIGDAVGGGSGEGTIGLGRLGTIGHGAGGGSGSGYGSGRGMIRGSVGHGVGGFGIPGLARLVRERFPGTLHFSPDLAVDASGTTELTVPLLDAITTYLVEVIVWREDGWSWSAETRFEVDREVVVETPLPERAEVGDRFRLPVRITNRGARPRSVTLRMEGGAALGVEDRAQEGLRLSAGETIEVPLDLRPSEVGEGRLTFAVLGDRGAPLDALRRPLRVRLPARPVHRRLEALAGAGPPIRLEVPEDAIERQGSTVEVIAGPELFGELREPTLGDWAAAFGGATTPLRTPSWSSSTERLAMQIATSWGQPRVGDPQLIDQLLPDLTRRLAQLAQSGDSARSRGDDAHAGEAEEREEATVLLALTPAIRALDRRPEEAREALSQMARALRDRVRSNASERTESPDLLALSAAALAWTAPPGGADASAAELLQRALRWEVRAGEDLWIAAPRRTEEATALAALAHVALGDRARADQLLSTLGRWASTGRPPPDEVRAYASAALLSLTRGRRPIAAELRIDGRTLRLPLTEGHARAEAEELGRPGVHSVAVRLEYEADRARGRARGRTRGRTADPAEATEAGSPALLRLRSEYGRPWEARPEPPGPLALELEVAPAAARGAPLVATLTVRNRGPRVIAAPVIELGLPPGARLTERVYDHLRAQEFDRRAYVLYSRPLMPGASHRWRIPLRFELEGRFMTFGVGAHPEDRPEAESALPPRELVIQPMEAR